jgi:CHAD domain-containing protein
MEFFRFAYGAEFTDLLKIVKDFVETLGKIHDRDVTLAELSDFFEEIRIFNKITSKSKLETRQINKLIQKLSKEREDQLGKVSETFSEWVKEDFRRKLIMSLS